MVGLGYKMRTSSWQNNSLQNSWEHWKPSCYQTNKGQTFLYSGGIHVCLLQVGANAD